jgi:hypothetical protein
MRSQQEPEARSIHSASARDTRITIDDLDKSGHDKKDNRFDFKHDGRTQSTFCYFDFGRKPFFAWYFSGDRGGFFDQFIEPALLTGCKHFSLND